jgi:hypothetical protein
MIARFPARKSGKPADLLTFQRAEVAFWPATSLVAAKGPERPVWHGSCKIRSSTAFEFGVVFLIPAQAVRQGIRHSCAGGSAWHSSFPPARE